MNNCKSAKVLLFITASYIYGGNRLAMMPMEMSAFYRVVMSTLATALTATKETTAQAVRFDSLIWMAR